MGCEEFGLYSAKCHGSLGMQAIPNPVSTDGSVPVLNPIDPIVASSDPKVFAGNVGLFVEPLVWPNYCRSRMDRPYEGISGPLDRVSLDLVVIPATQLGKLAQLVCQVTISQGHMVGCTCHKPAIAPFSNP
jgi:hypothetical protein